MKLPSSARHQAPLPARPPLPVSHPPVLPAATPSPGVPTPAFRTRCLRSGPCAGSPASRRWGSLLPLRPLQPAPRPFYGPTFLSSGFDSRSSSAARAVTVGDPHCTSRRSILLALRPQLLLAGRRALRLPASLFPSDCQRAPTVPTPAAHARLSPSVTFPGGGRLGTRGFIH